MYGWNQCNVREFTDTFETFVKYWGYHCLVEDCIMDEKDEGATGLIGNSFCLSNLTTRVLTFHLSHL